MSEDGDDLTRECQVLTRYLVGADATDYVLRSYAAANDTLEGLAPSGSFDRLLLRLARGPALSRWPVAAFARVHAPGSALQARLVTLLAILETTPATSRVLDSAPLRAPVGLTLALGVRAAVALLALAAGTVVLLPLRWIMTPRSGEV